MGADWATCPLGSAKSRALQNRPLASLLPPLYSTLLLNPCIDFDTGTQRDIQVCRALISTYLGVILWQLRSLRPT